MPQGNGTGPNGQGPITGRGMGYCAGFNAPGFMSSGFGRGFGRGRGFAWRARAMPIQPQAAPMQQIQPTVISEVEERQYLKQELEALKEETQEIEARLKELSKKKD